MLVNSVNGDYIEFINEFEALKCVADSHLKVYVFTLQILEACGDFEHKLFLVISSLEDLSNFCDHISFS